MQCTSVVCDLEVSAHFQTENHMGKLGVIQKPLRVWSIFVLRFLISYYNRRLFSKVENKKKKQKQKLIANPIKKNYQEDCKSIIEIFVKMKKLK